MFAKPLMEITSRQNEILSAVVREYIRTATPVASGDLVARFKLNYSSATVRNEMVALEEAGYLAQPHPSAGRVPTEKAYQYYIANCLESQELDRACRAELETTQRESGKLDERERMKRFAQVVARQAHAAVLVGSGDDVYITGFAQLFTLPECADEDIRVALSRLMDEMENTLAGLVNELDETIEVRLGDAKALPEHCSAVTLQLPDDFHLSILGPMRMDYDHHVALLNYVRKFFEPAAR